MGPISVEDSGFSKGQAMKLLISLTLLFSVFAQAQVLGPSVQEVNFQYSAEFITSEDLDAESLAQDHANYMFGLLQSPELVRQYGLDYDLVGGIANPRSLMTIRVQSVKETSDGRTAIRYSAWAPLLMHKKAAARALREGQIVLPMPVDMDDIYDKKCTDPHYESFGDYWYFWNPYQAGCDYLLRSPYTKQVALKIKPGRQVNEDVNVRLDLLRGDNGNGELFSIYVIHGFNESADAKDDGRLNFEELNEYLRGAGFVESIERKNPKRPLYTYTKELRIRGGQKVQVEVKHLLVDTDLESRGTTFAKFFKEAVYSADVIVYGGHSGLGANLDIPSLEEKAGKFKFNSKKRQIFYFDSCSSYSYYLESFAAEKTKSKIDVITNGLSSYFETSQSVLEGLFESLLTERSTDLKWMSVLRAMEEPLDGGSYLLSVGGI